MNRDEALEIVAKAREAGKTADLSGADLSWANLSWADLSGADLSGADLSGANLSWADLSGATGLLDPATWLDEHFGRTEDGGLIVYKRIGVTDYPAPERWIIEPGAYLEEVCNPTRTNDCACGVNFGTLGWCNKNYTGAVLWRCKIHVRDFPGIVVPYHTDGKARCARLQLIEIVEQQQ